MRLECALFAPEEDKNLWIRGCGGHVELVILIKLDKLAGGRVSGKDKVWVEDAAANIFKKTAIDSCSLSFLHIPPHLLLPNQYTSPDHKYLGVRYFLGATPERPRVPSGRASNCCSKIAGLHGLVACAINGFHQGERFVFRQLEPSLIIYPHSKSYISAQPQISIRLAMGRDIRQPSLSEDEHAGSEDVREKRM